MARAAPIWNAFNAGELSPLLDGRTDQDKYFSGCKRLENFIPTPQGPAVRRGGTRYLGTTKSSGRAWFVPFEFSSSQGYMLEFGDSYLRFWTNRGQLLSGATPYELSTPWTSADLVTSEGTLALRTAQSGDVMWICHAGGDIAPYKLSRLAATSWTLELAPFDSGPFVDVDPDNTVELTSTGDGSEAGIAVGTSVTLTTGAAYFRSTDVGTQLFVEGQNPQELAPWEASDDLGAVGEVRRYEGNVYTLTAKGGSKSGVYPPVHLRGKARDGGDVGGSVHEWATWEYQHSGYGWAEITAYSSTTSVTATVTRVLPTEAGGQLQTKRFGRAAFNDTDGWPTDVTFFRERLVYARGRELFMSWVGDYDNFAPYDGAEATKETAVKLTLASDRIDQLRWVVQGRTLLCGTAAAEMHVREQTGQQVFAFDNVTHDPQTERGSRLLEPLKVGGAVLFVQRSGRTLVEMLYDYGSDSYADDDLTVLAEHVLDAGVVDMDFQQEPDNTVWCVLDDGTLAALTYNRKRGVVAWARHVVGGDGFVETVGVLPSPDNRRDDVWLVVKRTINGATVRYVEYVEDHRLCEDAVADSFYLDAGITYDGAAVTTVTGLSHLEGATVQVLADGAAHPDRTVSGGQISLSRSASVVHVGFNSAARLQTMRMEAGGEAGTSQGQLKAVSEVTVRLKDTVGGRLGPDFDRMDALPGRSPTSLVGSAPELYTGDRTISWPAGYDRDGYLCVEQDQPLPMTVVALMPRVDTHD